MRIWIDTSNEGTRRPSDIHTLLCRLGAEIALYGLPEPGDPKVIMDVNGNTVGGYCNSADPFTSEQFKH